MENTLQQIKDGVAKEYMEHDFYSCYNRDNVTESMIDQIAIRYAQEQNKQLQEWKESMMTAHNELDLQGIGNELGLRLGSSISPQVLPKIRELLEQNNELLDMLRQARLMIGKLKRSMLVHPDCELGSEFCDYTTDAQNLEDEIEQLITKHKGG